LYHVPDRSRINFSRPLTGIIPVTALSSRKAFDVSIALINEIALFEAPIILTDPCWRQLDISNTRVAEPRHVCHFRKYGPQSMFGRLNRKTGVELKTPKISESYCYKHKSISRQTFHRYSKPLPMSCREATRNRILANDQISDRYMI
jgi:hypothetical protein